jgi:DNA repair exonuclease SbcCD ATPase subunit
MNYFRAISPYFILSRRRFDVSLKRAGDAFRNFQTFLSDEYVKAESAEGVASQIEELNQSLTQLKEFEKTRKTRKKRQELLNTKITENQQKMKAIQSTDEVVELAQIKARIKDLEDNVKHDLRHIQKPLLKFQTLASSPGYNLSSDATNKLTEYLDDSFRAFATENEGYPLLRDILQKIDDAMQKGKLKLKPSRMRKAKEQIDDILNKTALLTLHQNCREAFNKKSQLATSGAISETRDKRNSLKENLTDLQRKKGILERRDAAQEKESQRLRARVDEQKKELQKVVVDLVNKDVQIILD